MTSFTEQIKDWQVFYATMAAACATLVGLLFVAVSLNAEYLFQKKNAGSLRIARKAFGDFLQVLLMALLFLIPNLPPIGLGAGLMALGVAGLVSVTRQVVLSLNRPSTFTARRYLWLYSLSFIGTLGVIALAIAMVFAYTDVLYWLVLVWTALLVSGSTTAWSLLTKTRSRGGSSGRWL